MIMITGAAATAHKISGRSVQWFQRYAREQIDTQTAKLIAILCSPSGAE